jgi:hypothetical protein
MNHDQLDLLFEVLRDIARPKIVDLGGGFLINLNLIATVDLDVCPGSDPEEFRARVQIVGMTFPVILTVGQTKTLATELGMEE